MKKRGHGLHSTTSRWLAQGSPSPNSPRLKHKLHITGLSHINYIWVTSSANYETIIWDDHALIFRTWRMKRDPQSPPSWQASNWQQFQFINNTYRQNRMYTSIRPSVRDYNRTHSKHPSLDVARDSLHNAGSLGSWSWVTILVAGAATPFHSAPQPVPSLQILTTQWTRAERQSAPPWPPDPVRRRPARRTAVSHRCLPKLVEERRGSSRVCEQEKPRSWLCLCRWGSRPTWVQRSVAYGSKCNILYFLWFDSTNNYKGPI